MDRRLTAILAADVAGYSRHTDRQDESSTAALRERLAVVKDAIAARKGRIFTTAGDGVVAEFLSVVEAIRCAVEIQREIELRNDSVPESERMQFRIGVNLSDVISEDKDLYGTGVNVAVRLERLARPGGICVSQTVYDQVRKIVEIPFEDIGERRLKNIADPVHVYRILPAPLSWDKKFLSHLKNKLRRPEFAVIVFVLMVGVAGGASYYLREPAALWSTLLSEFPKNPAIAVLPFKALGDPREVDFAEGLTDDIITGLSRSRRGLRVHEYQGKPESARDIGRELNVNYVLEGSVKPSEDRRLRISPELKDAQTGDTIWKDDFDRKTTERVYLDDEITCQIVAMITGGYGVIESKQAESAQRKNPTQVQADLDSLVAQARQFMKYKWSPGNFNAAKAILRDVIKRDPYHGAARRELAWYNIMGWYFGIDVWPLQQRMPREFIAEANKAVQLESADGRAHMVAATAYFFNKDLVNFQREAKRAEELAPCDPEVLAVLGALIANGGQWQRGVEFVDKAYHLNPDASEGWYHSTKYLKSYLDGDYEGALHMIKSSPDYPTPADFKSKEDPAFYAVAFYAVYDYLAICGQLASKSDGLKCGDDEDELSVKEAWRWLSEASCNWVEGVWDDSTNQCTKTSDTLSGKTIEDWYKIWNFPDHDIAQLMDGVYKSGVVEMATKVQPIVQEAGSH